MSGVIGLGFVSWNRTGEPMLSFEHDITEKKIRKRACIKPGTSLEY
jgi:hypothetical protein